MLFSFVTKTCSAEYLDTWQSAEPGPQRISHFLCAARDPQVEEPLKMSR